MSNNVFFKLQKCRLELQLLNLKKSGKNKFAGFTYYELADFLPAINKLFFENGLFSLFSIINDLATLEIINAENKDETITFSIPTAELELKGCNAIQALGGVNTYCKRYLYLNALEIVEADLFDSTSNQPEEEKPSKQTQKQQVKQEMPDNDLDIIANITTFNDLANLTKYFNDNKDNVKDFEAFKTACSMRKKYLQEKQGA